MVVAFVFDFDFGTAVVDVVAVLCIFILLLSAGQSEHLASSRNKFVRELIAA